MSLCVERAWRDRQVLSSRQRGVLPASGRRVRGRAARRRSPAIVRERAEPDRGPLSARLRRAPRRRIASFFARAWSLRRRPSRSSIARSALRHPSRTGDPALNKLLAGVRRTKARRRGAATRPRRARARAGHAVLAARATRGSPTRTQIARTLRVTPRTLSRWLEADGKTYSDVIDEFRAMAAARHLQRPESSLGPLSRDARLQGPERFYPRFSPLDRDDTRPVPPPARLPRELTLAQNDEARARTTKHERRARARTPSRSPSRFSPTRTTSTPLTMGQVSHASVGDRAVTRLVSRVREQRAQTC